MRLFIVFCLTLFSFQLAKASQDNIYANPCDQITRGKPFVVILTGEEYQEQQTRFSQLRKEKKKTEKRLTSKIAGLERSNESKDYEIALFVSERERLNSQILELRRTITTLDQNFKNSELCTQNELLKAELEKITHALEKQLAISKSLLSENSTLKAEISQREKEDEKKRLANIEKMKLKALPRGENPKKVKSKKKYNSGQYIN